MSRIPPRPPGRSADAPRFPGFRRADHRSSRNPLSVNASEDDIRAFVTKGKISSGTLGDNGRDARDIMLGLARACLKLKLLLYHFTGGRLGIGGPNIQSLKTLIRPIST